MPRANRDILPGYAYHLTHRCHNRRFLFRFARDRTEYRHRLREALGAYDLALLNYCLLDLSEVLAPCGGGHLETFRARYRERVQMALAQRQLAREPWWTERIAVGRESFVRGIAAATTNRHELAVETTSPAQWTVRDAAEAYA